MSGIECEFVEKPPQVVQFECPICLLVLREPYQATCCGKSFCRKCIGPVKANNKDCPTCKDKNLNLFHNKGLQQSLNDFEVYCSHKSKGCEWRGELRELDKHLNSNPPAFKSLEGCPFTVISCPLQLSHTPSPYDRIAGLKCPLDCNSSSEKGVYRKDVKAHISKNILCHITAQTAHMKKFKQHLQKVSIDNAQLLRDKHLLEQRVAVLERIVCGVDSKQPTASKPAPDQPSASKQPSTYLTGTVKPMGAEFTMTGFEEYKRDNDVWMSPQFYTHSGGYKMCLVVFANGDANGKSTHLTLRMMMMKGDFDDQLKWPFRASITVQLLSQVDEDHYMKSIGSNAFMGAIGSRVTGPQQVFAKTWWGIDQFFPHKNLRPKYLKNDSIRIRVKKVLLV